MFTGLTKEETRSVCVRFDMLVFRDIGRTPTRSHIITRHGATHTLMTPTLRQTEPFASSGYLLCAFYMLAS